MNIECVNRKSNLIISINGEVDHHTCSLIKQHIDMGMLKHPSKNLIFDFSNVTFMDSSGLGMLMHQYKYIKMLDGKVAIVKINPKLKKIFDISGLLKIIPEYDDIDKAIESF